MDRMKIAACFLCAAVVSFPAAAHASGWKHAHEDADRISLADARAASERDPSSTEKQYILALAYLKQYDHRQAREIFRAILEAEPENLRAQWGAAECLRRFYNFEESEKLLDGVIRQDPDFSPAYLTRAYIAYLKMDFGRSARLAYAVMKQGRENVDLDNYVRAYALYAGAQGMAAYYGGPLSKVVHGTAVLRYLKHAEELAPDSPAVYFGMGSYYLLVPPFLGRDPDKAIGYLEKAVAAAPFFSDVYVRLAQAYKLKDRRDLYEKYLDKALQIDPENILALDIKSGTCKFICVARGDP